MKKLFVSVALLALLAFGTLTFAHEAFISSYDYICEEASIQRRPYNPGEKPENYIPTPAQK